MPLLGRPMLDYVADSLLCAGLRHVCLVIGPDADEMREAARRIEAASGARVVCAVQQEPRGTADAVLAAEEFAAGDAFVLTNGDNLYPTAALRVARRAGRRRLPRRRLRPRRAARPQQHRPGPHPRLRRHDHR